MAKQTGRSLQLSAQGRQKADIALQKFAGKRDLAANLGMSPTTVTNFFAGRPVKRREFHEICKKLKLNWQEVADLPPITESESSEKLQDNDSDIDELVREMRSRCCDKIQHLYSKIQLLNRQQIDVDQLYVDVYVLEKLASESYATIPDLLKGSNLREDFDRLGLGSRGERSPGFEVASQHPRLMIWGKPGSGKSTFLRHLAVACCKGEFQADYIPILVELRDIKDASHFDLLNKIHKEFGLANQSQTEQILNQGKVLILLDGLDEVPGQSRRDVQDHIYEFSQQYYKNRFILTCRTQTTEYTLSTFDYVEVADFKPEQIEFFARNWFAALAETPKQGEELTAQFLEKLRLPENKQTAELAVTPILLSLTCWVFKDLKDLPHKRSDLYEQGFNLLLEKWDEKRGVRRKIGNEIYRKLSVKEKQNLLSYVAFIKFDQEQYVLFEQSEIQCYIADYLNISCEDSQTVLEAIEAQHGLLIERAQGIWSFSHLTFQEHFNSRYFVDSCDLLLLIKLATYVNEYRWRQVFLLTVEILPTADSLLCLMKQQIDLSVASEKKIQNFLTWINSKGISVKLVKLVDNQFVSSLYVYKLAEVRAFYFNLALHGLAEPDLSYALNPDVEDIPGLRVDKILTRCVHIAKSLITKYHIRNGHQLIRYLSKIQWDLLVQLKDKIPESDKGIGICKEAPNPWWKANGQDWIKELTYLMITYRNIGHDWQFSPQQNKLISNYCYANKLLVDFLNSGCVVSDEVRAEIEETLLLPIAEIEKRQQQM
jgi:predicted NACHT family NTPase